MLSVKARLQRKVRRASGLRSVIVIATITLPCLVGAPASAQTRKAQSRKPKPQPANPVAESKADVVKAAKEHRANLEKELALLEAQFQAATQEVESRRAMFAQGLIARSELEPSERLLEVARARRDARKTEIGETDNLIAEATAAEQLAKLKPIPMGGYLTTAALIRYIGPTRWILSDIGKVQNFFTERFGHPLPVSAFGQTPVHDRLGFDHHESVDVAAHPDSAEGQALIAYLRSAGISFIAFRQAVPGSATGAHIHIGQPSRRLAR
jgi:hypothetical protein